MPKPNDRFIEIDENNLDKEWVEQPKLYFRWATKLADARLAMDEAKANVDLVVAELDDNIRRKPQKYKIEKVTEPAVKQAILNQTQYIDAVAGLNAARHRVNIVEAGVNALEHRKRALENLVDLYGKNYFAAPTASTEHGREAKEAYEERRAASNYRKKKKKRDD